MQHDESVAPVQKGDILAAKYRIEDVIGVGGMGVVVAAMHLELEQRVALKFLLPQAAQNEELVGRFVREARASTKLKGNHVTKVLDVGRMDDGRAYIVMEYLEGRDLGAELKASREQQMPVEEAVGWMLQACEGLAEAHALGIVHRDLKPGNLFLTRGPDDRALVKVLDFGISKSINPNSSDMLSLTRTEMLLGSPLYMAPEQMRSSKYVDERSDIWALGAIAYELISRRVPFEADTLLDLCFKVAQEGCPSLVDLRPSMPVELSNVVMRCLEKEPENRWHDIGELALALQPFAGPEYAGSADRVIAILNAGGERARARRTEPNVRRSQPSFPAMTPVQDARVITGATKTERLEPSQRPSELAASVTGDAAVPASSAWGKTSGEMRADAPTPRRTGLYAGIAIVVLAAGAYAIFRPSPPPTAPPVTSTTVTMPSSPPPPPAVTPPPPPVETTTAAPTASVVATPSATATVAPPRPSTTPKPKPSASAAGSAKPAPPAQPEGDFIKVRD